MTLRSRRSFPPADSGHKAVADSLLQDTAVLRGTLSGVSAILFLAAFQEKMDSTWKIRQSDTWMRALRLTLALAPACLAGGTVDQWFSTFLMLQFFNTVSHDVVILNLKLFCCPFITVILLLL